MSSYGPRASPYPRFSPLEMHRRRVALEAEMAGAGADVALLYGANRVGSAIQWLVGWPVTREALVVVAPGERAVLFVQFLNHVPNARRMALEADVNWGGESTIQSALEELGRRGLHGRRVGVVGPLPFDPYLRLAAVCDPVDLNAAYTRLRLHKSAEELEWLRVGIELTDRSVEALASHTRPGVTERALAGVVERSFAGEGTTHIHYLTATPMSQPGAFVPAQWHSDRPLQAGDALLCEISASFWDHPGQLLRTFAVATEPPSLYEELHAVAVDSFEAIIAKLKPGATAAELVEASRAIEDAGFTTCDDLVHGFVGGYLPPVLHSLSRAGGPVPDFIFEAGMTVVVQPNVITTDARAGVQTGELVLVTEAGAERLHSFPEGLMVVA